MNVKVINSDKSCGTVTVPYSFYNDSHLIKTLFLDECDDIDEFIEDINSDGGLPLIAIDKEYIEFVIQYYKNYEEYFNGNITVNDEDRFQVITQKMIDRPFIVPIVEKEMNKRKPRKNYIPTEIFYIGILDLNKENKDIKNMTTLELANIVSMHEEYNEYWVNDFEKEFANQIHWEETEEKIDGKFSGKKLVKNFGLTGYYQMNSFGRYIDLLSRVTKLLKKSSISEAKC